MSRVLRPAYGLTRSEFLRTKDTAVRTFTTSQFFAAENDNDNSNDASRPTFAQRSERTSRDVNDLLKKSPFTGGASGPGPNSGGKVLNLQSLASRRARREGGGKRCLPG